MKKVVVFDFDLTLTDEHTGGVPEPFEQGVINASFVKGFLELLKSHDIPVYINTRGNVRKIGTFLKNTGIGRSLIKQIMGATTDDQIGNPYSDNAVFDEVYEDMKHIRVRGDESTMVWANRKQEILQAIARKERVRPSQIYFYDDTAANIRVARIFGFRNSFRVEPGNIRRLAAKVIEDMRM